MSHKYEEYKELYPDLTIHEFKKMMNDNNSDEDSHKISLKQNFNLDRELGRNHKVVMKERLNYVNSKKYESDKDRRMKLFDEIFGEYLKES